MAAEPSAESAPSPGSSPGPAGSSQDGPAGASSAWSPDAPEAGAASNAGPQRPAADEDAQKLRDAADQRGTAFIVNIIEQVRAGRVTIGETSDVGAASRVWTGPELETRLRSFVEPPSFALALSRLKEHHVVVLVGPPGTGRESGAFALLRELLPGEGLRTLSPALDPGGLAAEIARHPDRAFVVVDQLPTSWDGRAARHQFDVLAQQLVASGRFLVVTAEPGALQVGRGQPWMITWERPELRAVFERTLTVRRRDGAAEPPADRLAQARERCADAADLRAVLDLVAELVDGERATASRARHDVRSWFDGRPARTDVALIAAAAFTCPAPRRLLDEHVHRLKYHLTPDEARSATRLLDWQEAMPQSTAMDLLVVSRAAGETVVRFRSADHRRVALEELHRRYGFDLWSGLRSWLDELAGVGRWETTERIALALGVLSEFAFEEVVRDYLDPWCEGGFLQRLTVADALSAMCIDPRAARQALGLAIAWSDRRGRGHAAVAAMAFAGGLGALFPEEAVMWLWFLSTRGEHVAALARSSLALYVRNMAAVDRESDADRPLLLQALRKIRTQARHLAAAGDRDRLRAGTTCLELLRGPDRDHPSAVDLLIDAPACAAVVGDLWAIALAPGTKRGEALRCLHRADVELRAAGAAATADAVLERIHEQLDERRRQALARDLEALRRASAVRGISVADVATQVLGQVIAGGPRGRQEEA